MADLPSLVDVLAGVAFFVVYGIICFVLGVLFGQYVIPPIVDLIRGFRGR